MKKLSFLLALLMLVFSFVACKKQPVENPTEEDSKSNEKYDSKGYLMDDLGDDLDFGDETVTILGWKESTYSEFNSKEDPKTNIVDSALYERSKAVEQRLKVNLKFTTVSGNNATFKTDYYVKSVTMNNAGTIDLFASYSMTPARLAINGLVSDLNSVKYLDLEKPWWSNDMNELVSIYGKTYMATGDISPTFLANAEAMFFNQDLVDKYLSSKLAALDAENLYDLVEANQWDLDTFLSLCKGVGLDKTSDGKSADDVFAFVSDDTTIDTWFFASGLTTLGRNTDGALIISDQWASQKNGDLIEKLVNFFTSNDAGVKNSSDGASGNDKAGYEAAFSNGTSVFDIMPLKMAPNYSEMNFGILPIPKYTTAQENYHTNPSFTYTMYSISSACKNQDRAGAVMEALASESYRRVTPALFETLLKVRSSKNEDMYAMWDVIRDALVCDAGRAFTNLIHDYGWSYFRNTIMKSMVSGQMNYSTDFESIESIIESDLQNINDYFLTH